MIRLLELEQLATLFIQPVYDESFEKKENEEYRCGVVEFSGSENVFALFNSTTQLLDL